MFIWPLIWQIYYEILDVDDRKIYRRGLLLSKACLFNMPTVAHVMFIPYIIISGLMSVQCPRRRFFAVVLSQVVLFITHFNADDCIPLYVSLIVQSLFCGLFYVGLLQYTNLERLFWAKFVSGGVGYRGDLLCVMAIVYQPALHIIIKLRLLC